jgi:hypothetical protein
VNGCVIQAGSTCPGANLSGQNLQGANLAGANLATANLSKSNLSNANLSGSNLTGANLTGVTMLNGDLRSANLTNADFSGANLENVILTNSTNCGTIRTDGTIDDDSCPSPPPTTKTPPTTKVVTPPACDKSTLDTVLHGHGHPTLNGETAPACGGKYAAMVVVAGADPEEVALFKIGADADSWHLVTDPYVIGGTPPSVVALCPSLPPAVASVAQCPSH